jgi:hypothetical protein
MALINGIIDSTAPGTGPAGVGYLNAEDTKLMNSKTIQALIAAKMAELGITTPFNLDFTLANATGVVWDDATKTITITHDQGAYPGTITLYIDGVIRTGVKISAPASNTVVIDFRALGIEFIEAITSCHIYIKA